jgi:hypothetical protein
LPDGGVSRKKQVGPAGTAAGIPDMGEKKYIFGRNAL